MANGKADREKIATTSGDILSLQNAKLRELFPEVWIDGKIDFDRLRSTLGAAIESGPSRFTFSWAGKDDAIALLQTPSRATLIPSPDESIDFEATGNAFIEGDNLEVLKLLFKPYFGRVKRHSSLNTTTFLRHSTRLLPGRMRLAASREDSA